MTDQQVPILQLLLVFSSLFVAGTVLTLPLFRFKMGEFVRSSLFVKIALWIPIFLTFLAVLYLPNYGRLAVLAVIGTVGSWEAWRVSRATGETRLISIYTSIFLVALAHFAIAVVIFPILAIPLLITICFSSVFSDVCAFFFGKYLGRHHLPPALNSQKSWEGVAGQLVGAAIGIAIVHIFITQAINLWAFIPLGLGSALGDLMNSFVKRRLDIKDWSQSLPGHGGFLDRFASLACSTALTFYALILL